MHIIRTRFGRDIVAEVGVPARRASRKVMLLLAGAPTAPGKKRLIEFLARKGYWTVFPRYRGSWESGGVFLKHSPEEDVYKILDALPKGFTDFWSGEEHRVSPKEAHIIASSFGGPAAILSSRDTRITKAVAFSPVVDWTALSKEEPLDWLYGFMKQAFGEGYRMGKREWRKLESGAFYNPARHVREIDGEKLFIIHAKDDKTVLYKPVERFAKKTRAQMLARPRGGHFSVSRAMQPFYWKRIRKFLDNK